METVTRQTFRVVIIEDEKPAAEKLAKAILLIRPEWQVAAILHNCTDGIRWLTANEGPDLIFMDIQLTDGLSFDIFEKADIRCPVIFVTAFDHYWQMAFAHNGIDYLLKPLKVESLALALKKYEQIKTHFTSSLPRFLDWVREEGPAPPIQTKARFLLKRGLEYIKVDTKDIAYLFATQKVVCLVTFEQGKFILDRSLTELSKELDNRLFYRINRKYIVNHHAITSMKVWSKSKLKIELVPPVEEPVIISSEQVAKFKKWLVDV